MLKAIATDRIRHAYIHGRKGDSEAIHFMSQCWRAGGHTLKLPMERERVSRKLGETFC